MWWFPQYLMIYREGPYSLLNSLHLALQLQKPFKTLGGLLYKDLISYLDHAFSGNSALIYSRFAFYYSCSLRGSFYNNCRIIWSDPCKLTLDQYLRAASSTRDNDFGLHLSEFLSRCHKVKIKSFTDSNQFVTQ